MLINLNKSSFYTNFMENRKYSNIKASIMMESIRKLFMRWERRRPQLQFSYRQSIPECLRDSISKISKRPRLATPFLKQFSQFKKILILIIFNHFLGLDVKYPFPFLTFRYFILDGDLTPLSKQPIMYK